ncbi:MAG: SDR family NAD(P)-dependent oxidoreductase [Bacteroidota bacterium]
MKASYNASGKTYVIVGSNSGIGKALIQLLHESKAQTIGLDIQPEAHQDIKSFLAKYYSARPTHLEELQPAFEAIQENTSSIDGLINLSGTLASFKPFGDMTPEEWNETYDISFKSCYHACKTFLPLLQAHSKGAIVNMSSGLAFGGQQNYGPYTTAKLSVVALTRTLATELAPHIRVNSVAPGAVDTNFIYQEDGSTRFNPEMYKKIAPLGTIATPMEIASVIQFLLSDGASHLTGQCIHINGGAFMA